MAALGDTVMPLLRPAPNSDNFPQGPAPILLGHVMKAGSGGAGFWMVKWSNGAVSPNVTDAALRVLVAPLLLLNVGMRAKPVVALGRVSPDRIGTVVLHTTDNNLVLKQPNGTLYTLSVNNTEFPDA